jgi:hypothetical protein
LPTHLHIKQQILRVPHVTRLRVVKGNNAVRGLVATHSLKKLLHVVQRDVLCAVAKVGAGGNVAKGAWRAKVHDLAFVVQTGGRT